MLNNKADLIFMKWKAELASSQRTWDHVESNFELLWDQFFRAKIKMDEALPFLNKAAIAHHPNDSVINSTFKKMKPYMKEQGLQEYEKSWKEKIDNKCKEVFFAFYEIDGVAKPTGKVGGMSKAENAKLQRYADSHETVDWEALIRESEEPIAEDDGPKIDLSQVNLDVDLGDL